MTLHGIGIDQNTILTLLGHKGDTLAHFGERRNEILIWSCDEDEAPLFLPLSVDPFPFPFQLNPCGAKDIPSRKYEYLL